MDSLEIARRMSVIHDGGPIYNEFVHDSLVREPWNAYSSLFFFVPVAFWLWKLRGQWKDYPIFAVILPLLFLNGLGSTLYHAFRSEEVFLLLDWMPASFMTLTLSGYLWTRLLKKWYWGVLMVLGFYAVAIGAVFGLVSLWDARELAPNIGYFFIGASFILPLLLILLRTRFYKGGYVGMTLFFLLGALAFRTLDYPTPNPFPISLPQGTHFLWHVFSAMAVFTLGYYIYFTNKIKLGKYDTYPPQAIPKSQRGGSTSFVPQGN